MDSCHYFPIKQGLYGKQASDEKIVYGLINGVKGAIRLVIYTFWCKVPLNFNLGNTCPHKADKWSKKMS